MPRRSRPNNPWLTGADVGRATTGGAVIAIVNVLLSSQRLQERDDLRRVFVVHSEVRHLCARFEGLRIHDPALQIVGRIDRHDTTCDPIAGADTGEAGPNIT